MDFLELTNKVARLAKPAHAEFYPLESIHDSFTDGNLDSMDVLILCMYMAELYGVSDEASKTMQPKSPNELLLFLSDHGTKQPSSVDEALESIK